MLGHRRTVPLWRQRRMSALEIERSLLQRRSATSNARSVEFSVIAAKLAQRKLLAAKHRARLSDA